MVKKNVLIRDSFFIPCAKHFLDLVFLKIHVPISEVILMIAFRISIPLVLLFSGWSSYS